jgi:Domain of unknown function (DUF4157)
VSGLDATRQVADRADDHGSSSVDFAVGRDTWVPEIDSSGSEVVEVESLGPAGEEEPFDVGALVGSFELPGMATSVAEQPAEDGELERDPGDVFDAAASGPSSRLPHRERMEEAFGRSLDDVTAHVGVGDPLVAIDAEAATRGSTIAFASSDPSPELVAHELAHTEQNRRSGEGSVVNASGALSDRGSAAELEAEHVGATVASGGAAPAVVAAPGAGIQRSFLSFALKMGAKKASKGMLKNFIKTRIKDKIKNLINKKVLKEIAEEADQIMGILEDPWWVTAVGFIPIVGDAFDLYNVPKQIVAAIKRADQLENKAKRAIDAQQAAQRTASQVKKALSWTAHGGKHVPNPRLKWPDIVASTKNGPAKYLHGTNIEALERKVFAEGKKVTNGKNWRVMEFPNEIGASEGKSVRWMRVEESANTIHGHPITHEEYLKLLR